MSCSTDHKWDNSNLCGSLCMQGQFWGASGVEGGRAERPNHSVGSLVRIASEDEVIRSFLGSEGK